MRAYVGICSIQEISHSILVAIIHESYNLLYSIVNKIKKKSNQTMHFEHTYIC